MSDQAAPQDEAHAASGVLPSLLSLPGRGQHPTTHLLSETEARDLGIGSIIQAVDWTGRHARFIRTILVQLVDDAGVIAYRQELLAELAGNQRLQTRLVELLPHLAETGRPSTTWAPESPLLLVPPRLSALENYVNCINTLNQIFTEHSPKSAALRGLCRYVESVRADPQFESLAAELPQFRAQFDRITGITVGINLDSDLRPASATLVALHTEPFTGPRSLADRLFGRSSTSGAQGMTALRHVSERSPQTDPLAQDLEKVLTEVIQPIATGLERYHRLHARSLAVLEQELAFYLGAIRFADQLRSSGLPVCIPAISEHEHRLIEAYNPALALQLAQTSSDTHSDAPIIRNPIIFDDGRIVILTGPNRGGKTTYLRAIGLNQILFQAGMFVAAREAHMCPADAILTHFPVTEDSTPGGGRLDDEARRIRTMFARATAMSLLLFNEPLTSTGEHEARLIARDVLRALRLLGARTVYVTHLHALADEIEQLNTGEPGSRIVSWVAGTAADAQRTYEIRPGPPLARSHASTIAQQHGITFAQLMEQLQKRNVIED